MSRITANILRIVWACQPQAWSVAIAAIIFYYAAVTLLFIANLIFAQRILRAQHPYVGWSKSLSILFPVLIVTIIATIFLLIAAVVAEFYTLGARNERTTRSIQRYGQTLYATMASLPMFIVGISSLARRYPRSGMTTTIDKFGGGSMRAKIVIVMVSSFFLGLGAWYRAGTVLSPAFPFTRTTPNGSSLEVPEPSYLSKACFYIFNFTIEISIVYFWLAVRIDKRFYVPDGAKGPFSYAGGFVFAGERSNEKRPMSGSNSLQPFIGPPSICGSRMSSDSRRSSMTASSKKRDRPFWSSSLHSITPESKKQKSEGRISWGGVPQQDVVESIGEDGVQSLPYLPDVHSTGDGYIAADVGVEGAEKEMGWDPKSGKWALRPISSISASSATSMGFAL